MILNKGGDFISCLDVPSNIRIVLGTGNCIDLGDWLVDHVQEVLEAYVSVGAVHTYGGSGVYSIPAPKAKFLCGAHHPTLFTCVDTLQRGSRATPLTCTEPRNHGAFWHTALKGEVRWEP